MGPRACSFCVEMPISAPRPKTPPSVKRVEALTYTAAESTSRAKRRAAFKSRGDDAFAVVAGIAANVLDGLVHAGNDFHREDIVEKFHRVIVLTGGHGLRQDFAGARTAAQFDVLFRQPGGDDGQRRFGNGLVHQKRFQGRCTPKGAKFWR